MKKLILPLLFLIVLFSGFSVIDNIKEKRVVAIMQLVLIDGKLFIESKQDETVFNNYCEVYEVIAATYLSNCVDTVSVDPKIKKL